MSRADEASGPAGPVEVLLRRALLAPTGSVSGTRTATCTLSWNVASLNGEGDLPAAVVTWPGHTPVGVPVGASVTGSGSSAPAGSEPDTADEIPATAADEEDSSPEAADLDALPVGAVLIDVLAGIDVSTADDAALLDVAARWQDVVSWATAMQSRALGEIARRRSWTEEHDAAAAEISARLRVPHAEANKHLARGAGLAEHPQVLDALHAGLIDTAKADILLRSGNPLTTDQREEAITRYLPQAPDRTRRWLREKMNAFAITLNGSRETAKHAAARRAVFLDPADNAMAWLSANLPACDAAAVWDSIEQTAHALRRAPGATRTLAQARADALVAITTGRIIVPPHPECAPEAVPSSAAAPETAVSGSTPPEAALPRTTVPAAGCTCGGCTCGGTAVRVLPVTPQIRVTIAATTLLGLDNLPGHLEGYGPVPADIAAQIASDATWQRLITDPVTGILTDHSTTTYQPGKLLRRAVTARDQTCAFPQCDRPARWADLDHIVPFDHDLDPTSLPPGTPGQTRATNLQPLCRAHHLAKTHHGWNLVRDPVTGVTTWTAPTGHTYTRPPSQTGHVSGDITSLTDDTRARLGQPALGRQDTAEASITGAPATGTAATGTATTDGPTAGEGPNTTEPSTAGPSTAGPTEVEPDAQASPVAPPTPQPTTPQPTAEQPPRHLRRFPDEPPF